LYRGPYSPGGRAALDIHVRRQLALHLGGVAPDAREALHPAPELIMEGVYWDGEAYVNDNCSLVLPTEGLSVVKY
jgi:hypothetical protein